MCGRINLKVDDPYAVARAVQAVIDPEDAAAYQPRYNIAPTQLHWQVAERNGTRRLERARWGVMRRVGPTQSKLLINARCESVTGRTWGSALRTQRTAAIPTTGYYEWGGSGAARRPLWFHPARAELLWLAALYDEASENDPPTFTILTCPPNTIARSVHDRMPCVLLDGQLEAWLQAPRSDLLVPPADDVLVAEPVSRRLNQVRNDDPACLVPDAAPLNSTIAPGPEPPPAESPLAPSAQLGFAWSDQEGLSGAAAPKRSRRR